MREIRFQIDALYDPDYAGPKAESNKRENIIRRLARQKQAAEKYARRRTEMGTGSATPEEGEEGEGVQYESHSDGGEDSDEGMDQDDEDAQCEPDGQENAACDHPQESRSEKERPG